MAIVKKVASFATTVLLILVIALCVFLFIGKMNGGKTNLFGSEIMVVLSGSMSPTFDTGSIVAVKPVTFEEIKQGDIITFKDVDERTVTHRVLEINNGELVTKGDANDGKDSTPVSKDRVVGKVQYWVPLIGYLVEFIKSKVGMLVFLGVPGLYLVVSQIYKLFKMFKEEEAPAN